MYRHFVDMHEAPTKKKKKKNCDLRKTVIEWIVFLIGIKINKKIKTKIKTEKWSKVAYLVS